MDEREKAFAEHLAWWKEANGDAMHSERLTRYALCAGAAASAWNAALAWAAKQIGERKD